MTRSERAVWYDTLTSSEKVRTSLLFTTLDAAVPLRIAELRDLDDMGRLALAAGAAAALAEHGDDLQYGGAHCRDAVAALIRGLAVGAYAPGGISFGGHHWCAAGCDCPAAHLQDRAVHTGRCGCPNTGGPVGPPPAATPTFITVDVAGGRL